MEKLKSLATELPGQDLTFLGSAPFVYHCHHFNLFHDQTVDDALGEAESFVVKERAAHAAAWHLLADLIRETGASTPAERLELAAATLPWMGHGRVELLSEASGGRVRGEYLHYGFAWNEKYGDKVRRRHPADAFAAGFSAAATELAFGLVPGTILARETACFACREPACQFELAADGEALGDAATVDRGAFEQHVGEPLTGLGEDRITQIAAGLKGFVAGIDGDERGLVQAFGIFITRHLANYYNQTAYDTLHKIERERPQLAPVVEELFGESGHVCVFYTFGNLLLSPEWEGMVGPVKGDVEEIVTSCMAIARGLGFGHWTVAELVPGERFVMQTTSGYEAPFYLTRYGVSEKARCYFLANAARATMQLAHKVDWPSRPQLDESLYQSLFKSDLAWDFEITRCQTRGDLLTEIVVTKRKGSKGVGRG